MMAKIATALTGQGNQIDIDGALPKILAAVVGSAVPTKVTDITKLTNEQLDALQCGDKVVKVTGTEEHAYTVSYKAITGGGLCLTYVDASRVETVSYDRTAEGWAYNSTDVTNLGN